MGYLDEAFKDLHELEDGVDLQDEQEVKKAIAFMNGDEDNLAQLELIVDADADSEEDIKDSYVGELLLYCPVCHTIHYEKEENIVFDEENDEIVNVGDACPHCKQENGYEIVGKIEEYDATEDEPEEENEPTEDSDVPLELDDIEDFEDEETTKKFEESFKIRKRLKEHFDEDNLEELARFTGERLHTRERVRETKKVEPKKSLKESKSTKKESKLVEKPVYGLEPRYDARKSFYGKAQVDTGDKGDKNKLYSYDTLVAEIKDGKPVVYGTYSQTTLRHIKEWLKQLGFKAENSKQILADYGAKKESCCKEAKKLKEGFRGCKKVEMIWHGSQSDPELSYTDENGNEYRANYYDIEDGMYEYYKEEHDYATTHNDKYAKSLNATYDWSSLDGNSDDDFDKFVMNHEDNIINDIIEYNSAERDEFDNEKDENLKEGYYDYMDKDYAHILDSNVDVYDVNAYVLKDSDNKFKAHYTDEYAIIVAPNGKGCVVDYEAVGQDFDSVDSDIDFGVVENKDDEYTDEKGNKHKTISMIATHRLTTTPKEIMENAPKKTMKYKDFFKKYKYNDRCASNFRELVSYLQSNGAFKGEKVTESKNLKESKQKKFVAFVPSQNKYIMVDELNASKEYASVFDENSPKAMSAYKTVLKTLGLKDSEIKREYDGFISFDEPYDENLKEGYYDLGSDSGLQEGCHSNKKGKKLKESDDEIYTGIIVYEISGQELEEFDEEEKFYGWSDKEIVKELRDNFGDDITIKRVTYVDNLPDHFETLYDSDYQYESCHSKKKKPLNEGPGAGYSVTGMVTNVHNVEVISDVESRSEYYSNTLMATAECDIVGVQASSYYDGREIVGGAPIPARLEIKLDYDKEEYYGDAKKVVEALGDDFEFDATLGGGWGHVTFTGVIEGDYHDVENSPYSTDILNFSIKIENENVIKDIDKAVTGEDWVDQYDVIDADGDIVDSFDTEDEAIDYAKANRGVAVEHRQLQFALLDDFESEDIIDEYTEGTVWEREYTKSYKYDDEQEEALKTKKVPPVITDEQKACKDKECKKKELDESLIVTCDFSDYRPWSGAISTYERIEEEGKLDDLENLLEECYPEGISMVGINDILWFDSDWVFEMLGITDDDEEDFDESLFESLVDRYCQRVYDNVRDFKTTSCSKKDKNFIVEGILHYTNGKKAKTTFTFKEAKTTNGKRRFVGLNETFSKDNTAFTLLVSTDNKKLLSESLSYKYNVEYKGEQKEIKGKIVTPKH